MGRVNLKDPARQGSVCVEKTSVFEITMTEVIHNTAWKVLLWAFGRDPVTNLDTKRIKPHFFRIGGASFAMHAGLSDAQIRALGRWKSDVFLKYTCACRYTLHTLSTIIILLNSSAKQTVPFGDKLFAMLSNPFDLICMQLLLCCEL